MAVKKSTINKKLPLASTIRWCSGPGKSMYISVGANEEGVYSRKIGFKQPANITGISWQIVYRYRRRYKPSKAKGKTGSWSSYSSWRTPVAGTSFRDTSGVKKTKKAGNKVASKLAEIDYWRCGNVELVTNNSYNVFVDWTSASKKAKTMPADYDAVEFQFAIRSFKPKTCQHGDWVYTKLKVFRKARIEDEVLVKMGDGALQLDFNFATERKGKVTISSIKDSAGNELLISTITSAPYLDTARQSSGDLDWYPYKRSGYVAAQITINSSRLKRAPLYNEYLTVTAQYVTSDGYKTNFNFYEKGFVCGQAAKQSLPKPRVTCTYNKNTGLVTVKAYKTDEFTGTTYGGVKLTKISCYGGYNLDGSTLTLNPYYTNTTDMTVDASELPDLLGTWYFRPPLNTSVKYRISCRNEYNQWDGVYTTPTTVECSGCILNGITYGDIHAALTFNTSFSMSTTTDSNIELPFGRDLPFAVFGKGRTRSIKIKGYSVGGDEQVNDNATPKYIKQLAEKLGVYWLRNSKGETFKVAVTNVDYEYVTHETDMLNVTITAKEVS